MRPLLHNATTISVQPAPLPVPVSRPLVHELYAQAFALLPTIHTFYGLLTQKAKSLYDYLFNPAVTIVPAKEVDTVSDTPDAPMTDATTGETPPTPMEISPTPFSHLVEEFVNLEASFADPGRLSAPEIQSSDYSTEPLDTPAFDGSMFNHYHDLLHFLHDKLSEYFSSVQDPTEAHNFFLTFIVGPPDHINARPCLYSHIIGCHVSPPQDCHSVLFVPVGPEGVWNGPLDWAPLLVYLLVTALFPDLPCLVCTPSNQLRSFAALPALYTLFAPLSSSPCCPCVYFSSSEFVVRGDIFLYLPDTSPAAHPDKPPPPFRIIPPNEVIEAFRASRETHQQSCYTWRADLLDSHSIAADQHFPFYCTPYYGYSPPSLHDTHTMILELATFLISFAFLTDGSPIQALETAPPSPGSLLSPLSSIHSDYMSVYPGEGVFFLDNCPDPISGDPMIVTWLASFTRCPPPVSLFPDMITCLSPGDRNTMPGLFAATLQLMEPSPIPLGPSAQLHLTSSLLPPPFFRPTAQLQLSVSPCGGVGSLQYCHHFNPQDDEVSSLTDISWNSHHLPADFINELSRNIVALTRSKGLCVLLLPSTQEFRFSFLHTLRTLCAYRHGLYHIGNAPPDLDRLATFLSLPDATFNSEPCIFNQGSWLLTHQISYFGAWDFLPLAMQLSYEGQTYILTLCLRSDLPQPDHWEVSAGHFNWHEFRAGPPPLELFLVFGDGCLHLTTGNNNLASFVLPQRNSTPVPLINNGWTLSPATGAYFFARSSVSVGHLFPSTSALDDPYRFPRPNVVLWPNQTPAIFSHPLPLTTLADARPPPQELPSAAAVLYQLGLQEMLSPNILQCSTLNPFDWMVAYAALTLPHFCAEHIAVLQNPQVLDTFDTKIRHPLLSGQLEVVAAHFIALLPPPPSTTSEQPWILNSKTRKPPASTLPPTDDHILQVTPSQLAKSPFHLDNIHAAVANLASLLATADDLPKSPKGWIKVAILPTYAGKGVPGNFDTNTQEIVSNGVLTVSSYGVHKPLNENLIAALVAFEAQNAF